jgi:isopentenyl-diphosphate delta-isomerase
LELLRGDGRLMGFADGGIPTVCALIDARAVTKLPLIVSGGVRSGVDVAKGIALGADYGAAALPFLQAFANKKLENTVKLWKDEFRIAMFLAGAANLNQLKKTRVFVVGKTGEYLNAWRKAR